MGVENFQVWILIFFVFITKFQQQIRTMFYNEYLNIKKYIAWPWFTIGIDTEGLDVLNKNISIFISRHTWQIKWNTNKSKLVQLTQKISSTTIHLNVHSHKVLHIHLVNQVRKSINLQKTKMAHLWQKQKTWFIT